MLSKYILSETESDIMRFLWDNDSVILTKDLLDVFNEKGKDWKRQTLNTFLSRLELKDAVKRSRSKVWAACKEEAFAQMQSREMIDNLYGGKLSNLIVALAGGKEMEKDDEDELNQLLERLMKAE